MSTWGRAALLHYCVAKTFPIVWNFQCACSHCTSVCSFQRDIHNLTARVFIWKDICRDLCLGDLTRDALTLLTALSISGQIPRTTNALPQSRLVNSSTTHENETANTFYSHPTLRECVRTRNSWNCWLDCRALLLVQVINSCWWQPELMLSLTYQNHMTIWQRIFVTDQKLISITSLHFSCTQSSVTTEACVLLTVW